MAATFCLRLACGLIAVLPVLPTALVPPRFYRVQSFAKRVILGIGNFWRVVLIVSLVMALDFKRQPLVLDFGLRLIEAIDVSRGHFLCFDGHDCAPSSGRSSAQQAFGCGAGFGRNLRACQHARDFFAAVIVSKRVDPGGHPLALVERVF